MYVINSSHSPMNHQLSTYPIHKNCLKKDRRNLFYRMSRCILLYLGAVFYNSLTAFADIDIDIMGLSYHIGANSSHPAYSDAPRRLDKNGVFVFNPGIGLGWDFRSTHKKNGFSAITKAIYFRDCDDRGFFMLGGGGRYRYFFTEQWSGDINALITLSAGQEWYTGNYHYSILPLILLGANYHFPNDIRVGSNFSLAPRNTSFDATGEFWILFTTLQVSFPIFKDTTS